MNKPRGDLNALRERLADVMWDDVGVIRTPAQLASARQAVSQIQAELRETGLAGQSLEFNLTWHDWLNLQSLLEISQVIALAAEARDNSRGAHYREDHPDQGDLDSSTFTVVRRTDGELGVENRPVVFSIVKPGQSLLNEAA